MSALPAVSESPLIDQFDHPRRRFMVIAVNPTTGQGELLTGGLSERVAISFASGFNSDPGDDASDLRAYVVPCDPSEADSTAKAADRSKYWETVARRPGKPDRVIYSGVPRWAAKCFRRGYNRAAKEQGRTDRAYVRPCQPDHPAGAAVGA